MKTIELYSDFQRDDAIGQEIPSFIEGYSCRYWDWKAHQQDLKKGLFNWLAWKWKKKEILESSTAYLFFQNLGSNFKDLDLGRIPQEKLVLFILEPPTVQPEIWDPNVQKWFHKIFTWNDDLVDGKRFFKMYLPEYRVPIKDAPPYGKRKFLTLIASRLRSKHPHQLYSEREKVIRYFEARPDIPFDLYGRYWGKRKFHSWRGTIPDKLAVLKEYKFAFAYENSIEMGYITEKLWDCFETTVVPIYWGAPNVTDFIPEDCFIDRRKFVSDDDLLAFLESMTEEEWEGYIHRVAEFLQTDQAKLFTRENYNRTILETIGSVD
jgi:hypothetical protein